MASTDQYVDFFNSRHGNNESGAVLRTVRIQKGAGLGDFFANAFRKYFPYIKSGVRAMGGELLNTGIGLLRDTINGKNMRDSVRERVTNAGTSLTKRAAASMENMVGSGLKAPKRLRQRQSKTRTQRKHTRPTLDIFS